MRIPVPGILTIKLSTLIVYQLIYLFYMLLFYTVFALYDIIYALYAAYLSVIHDLRMSSKNILLIIICAVYPGVRVFIQTINIICSACLILFMTAFSIARFDVIQRYAFYQQSEPF